ncbi:hypothetical protein [Xanthomarina sp.]|uniref:hypothetical protein n=1 Tax=Xanthomarina sp. TaxID=1931211 RepID=UPI002BD4E234|nr:hypothetical protein [Xanthomarina sp.]HLV38994.1 hypothetical protein [Xanthomarina sp.]
MAFSLLFAYTLSLSISVQNYLIDAVSKTDKNHHVSSYISEFKAPELSIFPDLEPLGNTSNQLVLNFQTTDLKAQFKLFRYVEPFIVTKDNQYIYESKNIQPGLDLDALLYPFHTFS